MQQKWKVGVVGAGHAGWPGGTYSKLFSLYPRTEVTAVCDIDSENLEKAGKALKLKDSQLFTNYGDFINADIDVVMIATPMPLHAEQTIKAMESGKHVLCELTAATTITDCERIVDTVKKTKKTYMMAENYSYFYYIREWKKIISKGKLGKIYYAEADYIHEIKDLLIDKKTGKTLWRVDRPPLYYCAHSLGPLLCLMDDRIIKTTASGKQVNIMPDLGIGAIDMQVALFETQKGATIKILRSQVAPRYPLIIFYSLYGTKGFVENGRRIGKQEGHLNINADTEGMLYVEDGKGYEKGARIIDCRLAAPSAPEEVKIGIGYGSAEYYLILDFIRALDNNIKPPIDVIKAMDYTVPGIIAHEAAMESNVWMDVPLFEW